MEALKAKWQAFLEKTEPARKNIVTVWNGLSKVAKMVFTWVYRLRGVIISIPVGVCAVALAMRNMRILPEVVGINLMANGEYQFVVNRNVAVMGPLAVTAACLLLVFLTRKTLYPWLISVFSLALPLLIWLTNIFPA
ncbi:MAG: hypothetical protein IJB47_04940 [Oscillospiraceae bacterium]|nr:hypothetical protein [Oscillospiraceae bacterium]